MLDRLMNLPWDTYSAMATTLGLGVAGVSAFLGLITYRNQVEAQADMHMHGLFRGYLEARLHRSNVAALETLKLYVLEEMVDWVAEQRRALWCWRWTWPPSFCRRWVELRQWEATIRANLGNPHQVRLRIGRPRSKSSYGRAFHAFVEDACRREEIRRAAATEI